MSPLYPCSKPCSTGTHTETVKKLTKFLAFINRIMMESLLRISDHSGTLSILQSNRNSITFALTIIIHKSCNLIGILGSSEFEPTWDQAY